MEYNNKYMDFKLKGDVLLKDILSNTAKTDKKLKNFIFTLQKTEEKTDHKNCVWLCEMRYLNLAVMLADLQKSYGRHIKYIWDETVKLENMRINSIKKAMIDYLNMQKSVFMTEVEKEFESVEKIEENSTEGLFTKVFKEEEVKILSEIGINGDFVNELANWEPEHIMEFEWILKEGDAFIESGLFQQWQECYAVIVKSKFLHVFDKKPSFPFVEPIESLYLPGAKLNVNQIPDFYVEITESKRTGFFNKLVAGKQIVIRTKDGDRLNDWLELIKTL